jgi:RNA polymerase sigma factor (sigma-70 family)
VGEAHPSRVPLENRTCGRGWSNRPETATTSPGGPDPTVSVDDRDVLDRAFERLTPQHRAVFVLHHHVGLSLADIADVVGVPVGTVKSRLHHATRTLRAAIVADSQVDPTEARLA